LRNQIEVLATLQDVDREIQEKNRAKGNLLAEIQRMEEEIKAKRAEIELLRAEWLEKDRTRSGKERTLQEEGRKAAEKRMRMNRVKNLKELQALQREIDQIKQSNSQLEEGLIPLWEELEGQAASLKAKEEEVERLKNEWGEKTSEMKAQVVELEQAIAEATKARLAIALQVNGELIERYELIFSRRGGMAVVTVSGGTCQGCYMNIPPQLWNEIIKSERLNLCPSCHRILYYKPTVPTDKQL
jgi:predicted  nucleic acid-binding Zn-ribbon protein